MRYIAIVTKPRTSPTSSDDWQHQPPIGQATTIYEPDDAPADTGLLDATGTKLYRIRDKIKVGFV